MGLGFCLTATARTQTTNAIDTQTNPKQRQEKNVMCDRSID